jgi:hypothetical protein
MMGQARFPEMSVTSYQLAPRKIPGKQMPHILARLSQITFF